MRPLICLAAVAALAACNQAPATETPATPAPNASPEAPAATPATETPASVTTPPQATDDWTAVASSDDESRLQRLDAAWTEALAEARKKGFGPDIDRLGPLADPDAGPAGRLQPPPGNYRCRTIKLGSRDGAGLAFVGYGWFQCTVELTPGGDLILMKTTGSQRTRGFLYPEPEDRLVFVGAQAWGDEAHFPQYGAQPERDQIGVLETIGQNRWRLVLPWPKQESKLDLIELVPA